MTETTLETEATVHHLPILDPADGDAPRPSRLAPLQIIAGLIVCHGAATGILGIPMVVRIGGAILGLVITYRGLAALGRLVFGPDWDAAYWISVTWLAVIVGAALLAPLLPLPTPSRSELTLLDTPMARPDLFGRNALGTNGQSLDILSRIIWGGRVSLLMAIAAVLIGMVVGGGIGILAGYLGRLTDAVTGIFANSLLAFPPLVLLLALVAVLSPSPRNIAIALGILIVPANIRLARANTLQFSEREFVQAARAIGAKRSRVMVRELLPNVILPLISYGFVLVAILIVAEASLSFLGLGIQQPAPSWGNMIAEGLNGVVESHPHIVAVPGSILFTTVFAFNIVGERLRSKLAEG